MNRVFLTFLALSLLGCNQKPMVSSQKIVQSAPSSKEEVGWLVSGVSLDEIHKISDTYPKLKFRVINSAHQLFEVYGVDGSNLKTQLPQAQITKNEFFKPLYVDTKKENNFYSEKFYAEEGKSKPLNLANPKDCLQGEESPKAVIQRSDVNEKQNKILELKEGLQINSFASSSPKSSNTVLRSAWVIQPPEGSLKKIEFLYGPEINYKPDALGSYVVSLLVQDEKNLCNITVKNFNITSNEDFIPPTESDLFNSMQLESDLKLFHHLQQLQVTQLWNSATGKGQVIAIIDSGVNYNHYALKNNILINKNEIPGNGIDDDNNGFVDDHLGYDLVNNDPFPFDDHGHGSHVAGLAASNIFGIAKEAKILVVKAMSPSGGDTGSLVGGIYYAVDRGAKIINISLGNYGTPHPHLIAAIDYAESMGVIVVAAAGNGDLFLGLPVNTDKAPNYPSSLPNDNIISVAAYSENHILSPHSNYGKMSVDLVALGGDDEHLIYSTFLKNPAGIDFKGLSGTSMASPIVAGVVSLLWEINPLLSIKEIKNILMTTGTEIDELKEKVLSGRILNAQEAIHLSLELLKRSQDLRR
ncbi:MAG: S8 family serine peptidase [Bdellovibrionaceae bacterium]|nr:S8 family serine peptidase [Pseudobdellovibrionaceae bacterium]